jgi:hypothetical protein
VGAGVNQAAGQIQPVGHQLAIAHLENVGVLTACNPTGLHSLLPFFLLTNLHVQLCSQDVA